MNFAYGTSPLTTNIPDYSTEAVRKVMFDMQYEVDPEWARFCKFGPDDIGGCWEKLGIIRKRRPRPTHVFMPESTLRELRECLRRPDLPVEPDLHSLYGIRVSASPMLTDKLFFFSKGDT